MDDNKEKVTPETPDEAIKDEMEELAKVFQEELQKAKEEAENETAVESLEVDGYNPREVSVEEKAEDETEKQLCIYCNEKEAENGDYCDECKELLTKLPYDYRGIIVAILTVCITVAAIFCFAVNVPIFTSLIQGDKAAREDKLYTAMENYSDAAQYAENSGSEHTYYNIYAKKAIANFNMVNMGSAITEIGDNIPDGVLKLLTFKKISNILEETERMQASAMVAQQHLTKYPSVITKEVYEKIVAELDSLSGKKIYIKGTEYHDETEEDFTPDGTETVYTCDEGWLNMYKYAAAQEAGMDPKIIAGHLQACADSSEYMKNLVGSLLATTYAGIGEYEEAETLADELRKTNCQSIEPYMVMAVIYRYRDKDYDKAISTCDEGIEMLNSLRYGDSYVAQYGYMVQIQKALSLIMQEKYDLAYEEMTDAYDSLSLTGGLTLQIRDLYAVLALQNGDEEAFEALEDEIKMYEEEGIGFTDDVINYKAGKITLKEIAESGRYDLI